MHIVSTVSYRFEDPQTHVGTHPWEDPRYPSLRIYYCDMYVYHDLVQHDL
jgi:hypothetical protein